MATVSNQWNNKKNMRSQREVQLRFFFLFLRFFNDFLFYIGFLFYILFSLYNYITCTNGISLRLFLFFFSLFIVCLRWYLIKKGFKLPQLPHAFKQIWAKKSGTYTHTPYIYKDKSHAFTEIMVCTFVAISLTLMQTLSLSLFHSPKIFIWFKWIVDVLSVSWWELYKCKIQMK